MDVEAGPERQRVASDNDETIEARLARATGWKRVASQARHRSEGAGSRRITDRSDSEYPGAGASLDFPSMTYYGERLRSHRLSQSVPVATHAANLFTFRDHRDPWLRDMRRNTKQTLLDIMPGLTQYLGDFQVIDQVQNWIMDLYVAENFRRDGVVLVGDAFQTSCPAAGTGEADYSASRSLCLYTFRLLATPGMGAENRTFYDDP